LYAIGLFPIRIIFSGSGNKHDSQDAGSQKNEHHFIHAHNKKGRHFQNIEDVTLYFFCPRLDGRFLTAFCRFLPCPSVVFHVQVYPYRTGQPEKPNEQNGDDNKEQQECHVHGNTGEQNQAACKKEAKERRDDVRDEHGAVVEAWADEVFLPTLGAGFRHVKRLAEGERASWEQVALVAAGAF